MGEGEGWDGPGKVLGGGGEADENGKGEGLGCRK